MQPSAKILPNNSSGPIPTNDIIRILSTVIWDDYVKSDLISKKTFFLCHPYDDAKAF